MSVFVRNLLSIAIVLGCSVVVNPFQIPAPILVHRSDFLIAPNQDHGVSPGRSKFASARRMTDIDFMINNDATDGDVPRTMQAAASRFLFGPDHGPLSVIALLIGFAAWRQNLAALGIVDFVVAGLAVVFWGIQEYFLHQKVLHSTFDWAGKEIHRGHHAKPYFHISIDPAGLMVGWLLISHAIAQIFLPTPQAISATLGYSAAGLFYEWAHYIVHTKVRPPNDFWRRVRDNHMRHHNVDDQFWFSFSIPALDDWFGTNPSVQEVRRRKTPNNTKRVVGSQEVLKQETFV